MSVNNEVTQTALNTTPDAPDVPVVPNLPFEDDTGHLLPPNPPVLRRSTRVRRPVKQLVLDYNSEKYVTEDYNENNYDAIFKDDPEFADIIEHEEEKEQLRSAMEADYSPGSEIAHTSDESDESIDEDEEEESEGSVEEPDEDDSDCAFTLDNTAECSATDDEEEDD